MHFLYLFASVYAIKRYQKKRLVVRMRGFTISARLIHILTAVRASGCKDWRISGGTGHRVQPPRQDTKRERRREI